MKKILFAVMIALVVTFAAHCSAMESSPVTVLKPIIGNWYDAKGNLVLTISNDYKINGCTVMSVKYGADSAALYEIRINEGTGYRNITLVNWGFAYHETLSLNWRSNNEIPLRRTKEPRYFESVGGIYLGMHKDDVTKLYGQPTSVKNEGRYIIWKYREGFDVAVENGIVLSITIYKNSDRRFDWSGLSANSSRDDFAYKYGKRVGRRGGIKIGYGETIFIYEDKVKLMFENSGPL